MSRIVITTPADARALAARVRAAATAACGALAGALARESPIEVMRAMKFGCLGFDPAGAERPVNLLEQVHQTFAYLAAIRGVEHLLAAHPDHAPFFLDVSAGAAPNIVSADGQVVAETMTIVSPVGNSKLKADVQRMRSSGARYRYVFYAAEQDRGAVQDDEVQIVAVPPDPDGR